MSKYAISLYAVEWAELIEYLWAQVPEGRAWAEKLLDEMYEAISLEEWSLTPKGVKEAEKWTKE